MTNQSITASSLDGGVDIEIIGNHIYFYSDIHSQSILALTKQVKIMDNWLAGERIANNALKNSSKTPIWVHILSGGGELWAALAMIDTLRQTNHPVYTIAEGIAASAASLLLLAGTRRFVAESALLMIHQFSTEFEGTHEQFKDRMYNHKDMFEIMLNFYIKNTHLKKKKLKKMLRRDTWFNAKKAIKWGFAEGYYNKSLWEE